MLFTGWLEFGFAENRRVKQAQGELRALPNEHWGASLGSARGLLRLVAKYPLSQTLIWRCGGFGSSRQNLFTLQSQGRLGRLH